MGSVTGGLRSLAGDLWADGRGPILLSVAGGWFLSIGVRLLYPALLPHLQTQLDFDLTMGGFILSVLWVCYALGQLPAGVLSDWIGEGNILVVSTCLSAITIGGIVLSTGTGTLLLSTAVFGFSTALFGVARYTILANIYEKHDGTAIGLTMSAGEAGNALLPPIGAALAGAFAWQFGFGFLIPFFVAVTVVLWIVLPARIERETPETDSTDQTGSEKIRSLYRAVTQRNILLVSSVQVLAFCAWQGFTGFYPTYLVDAKGLDPTTASVLFGGFFAIGILVRPTTGYLGDRIGISSTLPLILLPVTLALGTLPFVHTPLTIIAVTAGSTGLLGYGVLTMTYLSNNIPPDIEGTGLGLIRTSFMLLGALSPVVIGYLAAAGFFDEVFGLLAGMVLVAAILSTRIEDTPD